MSDVSTTPTAPATPERSKYGRYLVNTMQVIVLILSVLLIVYMSIETFRDIQFLDNHYYMTFQFWVCMIFILDFFIELFYAPDKWRYIRHRWLFLVLSIPYLNLIPVMELNVSADTMFFLRFIPLARGALAMSIVVGYVTNNAVGSMFASYLVIMLMVTYFCSLIFFQREYGVNPQVDSYWTALWWAGMNVVTVGCNISPVTIAGKIVNVILPISGIIIFPMFTVYLTDFVKRSSKKS